MKGGSETSLKFLRSWLGDNIETTVFHAAPGWRPSEQRNLWQFVRFAFAFHWSCWFTLRKIQNGYDLIHVNHEGLIWYAIRAKIPTVCHVRTEWMSSLTHRTRAPFWFSLLVAVVADHIIFISENEESTYHKFIARSSVIYNIARGKE